MVVASVELSSFWVWIILFGTFGAGYGLRDLLSRYRRKRWRHRHDWLHTDVAGPERKKKEEVHHASAQ